jgi:hypothetical protein
MLLLSMAATGSAGYTQYPGEDYTPPTSPIQVHLTWQTNDTAHTMTVTWRTSGAGTGDTVKYDTVSRGGVVANYAHEATGSHHTFEFHVPVETENITGVLYGEDPADFWINWPCDYTFKGYIHDVGLTGLEPDTTYYFICGGTGGWSQEWSFRTAPAISENIVFAAGGDSRSPYGGEIESHPERVSNFPVGRNWVSEEMAANEPLFAIYTGDFVERAELPGHWNSWMDHQEEYWVTEDNRMIPIVPAIGNHEVLTEMFPLDGREYGKENAPFYYEQFALPGNERWYSLDFGPDLHVVCLDSEVPPDEFPTQASWLESDLAATDAEWIVVAFHRPPYSSGDHGNDEDVQEHWVPIFEDYGVDLVFSGHDHNYERSYPIKDGVRASSTEEGVTYVANGAWGAPTYPVEETNWWTATYVEMHHCFNLAKISAAENTLILKAIDADSNVLEEQKFPYWLMAALFKAENLEITPPTPEPEEPVYIFADIVNTGELPGSLEVPLVINGVTVDTTTVTLEPGEATTVTFTVEEDVGSYAVSVYGTPGGFGVAPREVALAPTAVWVAIVITIAVICILGTAGIVGRKR